MAISDELKGAVDAITRARDGLRVLQAKPSLAKNPDGELLNDLLVILDREARRALRVADRMTSASLFGR